MNTETIDTSYGRMTLLATETAQLPWLRLSGAASDDEHVDYVRELLSERPRGAMIDVGASYGYWSLALKDVVTSILAFEPQDIIFDLLVQNLHENMPGRFCAVHAAAWNETAMLHLPLPNYESPGNFGGVGIGDRAKRFFEVYAQQIDLITPKDPVSFIKIDVEGAERQVLLGATETIRRWLPVMYVEYEHKTTNVEGLRAQLDAMSYVMEERSGNWVCIPMGKANA